MDSEDERFIEACDGDVFRSQHPDRALSWSTSCRLLQNEEKTAFGMSIFAGIKSLRKSVVSSMSMNPWEDHRAQVPNYLGRIRLIRFFRTMIGFHKGSLDLAGRHPRRYSSLKNYWSKFWRNLEDVKAQSEFELVPPVEWLQGLYDVLAIDADPVQWPLTQIWTPDDPQKLSNFLDQWKLKSTWNLTALIYVTDIVSDIVQSSAPIFQKLCLIDLPTEVLCHVMQCCTHSEALRLGLSCALLRNVSLQYIYTTIHLRLHPPDRPQSPPFLSPEQLGYFRLNSDICARIQHFSLSDEWQPSLPHKLILVDGQWVDQYKQFWAPLREAVHEGIFKLSNVTTIHIKNWRIDKPLMEAILRHPRLLEIKFTSCTASIPEPCQVTCQNPANLALLQCMPDSEEFWHVLGSLPVIRSLHIGTEEPENEPYIFNPQFILPGETMLGTLSLNPFRTLERFIACPMSYLELDELFAWMLNAKGPGADNSLHLTHLKLAITKGLERENVRELLPILRGSPLQALSLDCLMYEEPEMLEEIAAAVPGLISLTLHYRRGVSYRNLRWKHPSWEYARSLARFHRLKYFGWNFQHSEGLDTVTIFPYCLQLLEKRFPLYYSIEWAADIDVDEETPDQNDSTIARCLAAHCPSLQAVIFHLSDSAPLVYHKSPYEEEWELDHSSCSEEYNLGETLSPTPPDTDWPTFL